jgi:hypothetical protein
MAPGGTGLELTAEVGRGAGCESLRVWVLVVADLACDVAQAGPGEPGGVLGTTTYVPPMVRRWYS